MKVHIDSINIDGGREKNGNMDRKNMSEKISGSHRDTINSTKSTDNPEISI